MGAATPTPPLPSPPRGPTHCGVLPMWHWTPLGADSPGDPGHPAPYDARVGDAPLQARGGRCGHLRPGGHRGCGSPGPTGGRRQRRHHDNDHDGRDDNDNDDEHHNQQHQHERAGSGPRFHDHPPGRLRRCAGGVTSETPAMRSSGRRDVADSPVTHEGSPSGARHRSPRLRYGVTGPGGTDGRDPWNNR